MRVRIVCMAALLAVVLSGVSSGQMVNSTKPAAPPKPNEPPTLKFTIRPASEPVPALKYQLLPNLVDKIRGNAAVQYNKLAIQVETGLDKEALDQLNAWNSVADLSLDDLPLEDVRAELQKHERLLSGLDTAARFNHCDWQSFDGRTDYYAILLPELQNVRQLGRLLGVRIRLEIAEGRYDDAVRSLQTGYALGQHVAEAEFLVAGLVGIANSSIMSSYVAELIQQPDAPNLYWALTSLPDPLIDLRSCFEGEMYAIQLSCPELADVENPLHGEEYWNAALRRLWRLLMDSEGGPSEESFPDEAAVALMATRGYPMARRALINDGRTADEVDRMPVSQVIMIYTIRTYNELRDDIFKWMHVPYWQVGRNADEAERRLFKAGKSREIFPIASYFLPAIRAAVLAEVRCEREIRMLRIVEAIRLHGRLPKSLNEITQVPIPLDPGTGRPFKYNVEGDTAILEAGVSADKIRHFGRRYEITFAPK